MNIPTKQLVAYLRDLADVIEENGIENFEVLQRHSAKEHQRGTYAYSMPDPKYSGEVDIEINYYWKVSR